MSVKQITKFTHVEGVAIYPVIDGVADESPAAIDVSLTLPELTFETAEVPYMGSMTVVDQTRISNIEISITGEVANLKTQRLIQPGLNEWKCVWVESCVNPQGIIDVVGYTVNAKGYCSSIPEGSKEVGSQANADYKMHCLALRKSDSLNNVYYDVDRSQGRIIVNGNDLRAKVNDLLGG